MKTDDDLYSLDESIEKLEKINRALCTLCDEIKQIKNSLELLSQETFTLIERD